MSLESTILKRRRFKRNPTNATKPLNVQRHTRDIPNRISALDYAPSSANRPMSLINSVIALSTQMIGGIGQSVSQLIESPFGDYFTFKSASPGHNLQIQTTNILDSTLIMLDILVRKFTGRKHSPPTLPALSPISAQLEIRSLALNITEKLETLGHPNQQYDSFMLYKSVESCLMRGDFDNMSRIVQRTVSKELLHETQLDIQCLMSNLLCDQNGHSSDDKSFE